MNIIQALAMLNKKIKENKGTTVVHLTQDEYDALEEVDDNTVYFIDEDEE